MNTKASVLERYSEGAQEVQASLCCPVNYDDELLKLLPQEIIEKDYGCGDPSSYVQKDDVVLDLGSGGGKICYMAAQLVGDHGKVIGIDMNDDMLALARKYQGEMSRKLGQDRVQFLKAHIQDLTLDLTHLEQYLSSHSITSIADYHRLQDWLYQQRQSHPLIADQSIDLVISNCVLNLVHDDEKQQMIQEIHRVLKPGGRVAISDIVSDETVPQHLKENTELWSGCISGAFQEQAIIKVFLDAGFIGIKIDKWDAEPWQVIEDIEFRSVTLTAIKSQDASSMDCGHAVIYKGPYEEICDDEGHVFPRGERMAVCERTYQLLTSEPYQKDFIGISPQTRAEPKQWCAPPGTRRPASETKGAAHGIPGEADGCC